MGKFHSQADVLVIGAGLAGFRAAFAAKQTNPAAEVVIVCPTKAPQGSSFMNVHNQLGIQVCRNDNERRRFIEDAIAIAPPGDIDTGLVGILAEESATAFEDIMVWGPRLQTDSGGEYLRVPGCFSQQPRAYILRDIHSFFYRVLGYVENHGVRIENGWMAERILTKVISGRFKAAGAMLRQVSSKKSRRKISARAVVLACGGETARFSTTLAGSGEGALYIHDWCRANGVEYVNDSYTQYVWCRADDFGHWHIKRLADKGAGFRDSNAAFSTVPNDLMSLFKSRATHAPVAHALPDRAIDDLLIKQVDPNGIVNVFHPDTGWEKVVLAAQVSSGGIRIDENGRTTMPGLLACGECAGGMHGANRMGGAMVLAGQVFGKRAGQTAASFVAVGDECNDKFDFH